MGLREFTDVPKDIREWGRWMRSQFQGGEVGTPGLADGAVTTAKLADSAVTTNKIANNAVGDVDLRDSAGLSVIGRSANTTGDPSDIVAANDGEVLRRSGTALGFGEVTNAGLADMAQDTIKGRTSGAGTGDPVDLTASQVATIVSAAVASALNLVASTWTPTLTLTTNLDAATLSGTWKYIRFGSMVVFGGRVSVDATAAGATVLGVSLPIASNFSDNGHAAGVGANHDIAGFSASIAADTVNDRLTVRWNATDTAARSMYCVGIYEIV